jgi:hypothetical protein
MRNSVLVSIQRSPSVSSWMITMYEENHDSCVQQEQSLGELMMLLASRTFLLVMTRNDESSRQHLKQTFTLSLSC